MNEPITKPRKSLMATIYQPAMLILLAAILTTQIFVLLSQIESEACKSAIEIALIASPNLSKMSNDYDAAVYDRADNINQQVFLATEFNFLALQQISLQQQSLIEIAATCR